MQAPSSVALSGTCLLLAPASSTLLLHDPYADRASSAQLSASELDGHAGFAPEASAASSTSTRRRYAPLTVLCRSQPLKRCESLAARRSGCIDFTR